MKAEIGIKDGRPYLRVEPSSASEASLLHYLRPFMPFAPLDDYNDGCGTVIIHGDRLPGMGNTVTAQDAT